MSGPTLSALVADYRRHNLAAINNGVFCRGMHPDECKSHRERAEASDRAAQRISVLIRERLQEAVGDVDIEELMSAVAGPPLPGGWKS